MIAKCPRCKIGGYKQDRASDGRPSFECTRCGHVWTCGYSGGIYAQKDDSMSNKARRPITKATSALVGAGPAEKPEKLRPWQNPTNRQQRRAKKRQERKKS